MFFIMFLHCFKTMSEFQIFLLLKTYNLGCICEVLVDLQQREKTCLRGFRQSEIQTNLLLFRDQLENCNFARSKCRYDTFQKANNKGADQTTSQQSRLLQ